MRAKNSDGMNARRLAITVVTENAPKIAITFVFPPKNKGTAGFGLRSLDPREALQTVAYSVAKETIRVSVFRV